MDNDARQNIIDGLSQASQELRCVAQIASNSDFQKGEMCQKIAEVESELVACRRALNI